MTWGDLGLFLRGSIAIVMSGLLGPIYDRIHRQSFKGKKP